MSNVVDLSSIGAGHDVGRLEPIKDGKYAGCYRVSGGALGITNSEGHYFASDKDIRDLFTSSKTMQRVIDKKSLKGESDHPTKKPGETRESFAFRFMSIAMDRVAFLIRRVEVLEPRNVLGQSKPVYFIMLTIEPLGVYGEALRSDLENPNSNTSFSIRCLSKRSKSPTGEIVRRIYNIITWDYVNEPGISIANKENSIRMNRSSDNLQTTESFYSLDVEDLIKTVSDCDLTMESNSVLLDEKDLECLKKSPYEDDFMNRWEPGK